MRHVIARSVIAVTWLCSAWGGLAQTPPAFEVASVLPSSDAHPANCERRNDCIDTTPVSLVMRNESLRVLIRWAYDLPPVQIEAPDWLAEKRFDVVAKTAVPADESTLRLMLQTLLADRFGLKVHRETRTMQGYAMTLAKGGPKFPAAPTEGSFVLERASPAVIDAHHARMADLGQGISGEIGVPVVDATGLPGRYEIHLDLTPYMLNAGNGEGQLDVMSILFTGFQNLLGIKLESRKVSVDILVIDHAEKTPTEN